MRTSQHNVAWYRRLRNYIKVAVLALCLLAVSTTARADEIQNNGLWIPNLAIQNIIDGKIAYITNLGSEMNMDMANVQGIKVAAYPDLWLAQEAIHNKQDAKALPLLQKVQGIARQNWVKHYAAWMNIHTLDRLGQTPQAIDAYLSLARDHADTYFLQRPPLASLPNASDAQKKDLAQRLTASLPDFEGVAKAAIQAMIQRLGVAASASGDSATPHGATTPAVSNTPIVGIGVVDTNAKITNKTNVIFSTYLPDPKQDPVTPLLYEGKWQEAIDKCQELLKGREMRMSMRLYQLGMAQLQLAEASGNKNQYMDAGLSFTRSVIYFPTSTICGPSLVELGYIHTKINRPDLALKLWDKAQLQVDETRDPQVFERLQKLIAITTHPTTSTVATPDATTDTTTQTTENP